MPGQTALLVAWWRRCRLKSTILNLTRKRVPMRTVRVSTVVLWGAFLLTIHVIMSGLHTDFGGSAAPPYVDVKRRGRPGFAPRVTPQQRWCQLTPQENAVDASPFSKPTTKVLLLTYLRAGGDFVGQLFDKSADTVFWSDPVDGILSDLYGTNHGWHPLDVFTNVEGTPRHVPVCEEEAIVRHLSNLFNCRLGAIPIDLLTSPTAILPSWRNKPFLPCLRQVLVDVRPHNNPSGFSTNVVLPCKELLHNHCPNTFTYDRKQLYKCFDRIQDLKAMTHIFLNDVKASKSRQGPLWIEEESGDEFVAYGKCMASVQFHAQKCLPSYNTICNSSEMNVIKSTRLRGEQLSRIMEKHPDLRVLYFVRDPRGIALSREKMGSLSKVSQGNYINEAVLLCQRMRYDLIYLDLLKRQNRNQIVRVHYEEFLSDPESIGRSIYKFLGREVPAKVENWLHMKTKQLQEDGPNGPRLKNMTSQAYKWRRQMPDSENEYIVKKCRDVLESLNFPLLLTKLEGL